MFLILLFCFLFISILLSPSPAQRQKMADNPRTHDKCANTEGIGCLNGATNTCSRCYLVRVILYKYCQLAHWASHKKDCKSPLSKATWKPAWEIEGRRPTFIGGGSGIGFITGSTHGPRKYLWGNVPALDIVNAAQNEGDELPSQLHLLFAASGDLRNVVKTVVNLPHSYIGECEIVINDRDFDIVARNVILLLIAIYYPPETAAEAMLHIWYSAFLTGDIFRELREKILPLIKDVCEKIRNKSSASLQSKIWKHQGRTLRLVLRKYMWDELQAYFEVPVGLSGSEAQDVMVATTLAPERKDYVDRAMYAMPPGWRLGAVKFRKEGVLLPFGASAAAFTIPNPTIFQFNDFWPMMDSADPLHGWPIKEIMDNALEAKNDLHGGLHRLLKRVLREFCDNLGRRPIRFELFHEDVLELPKMLAQSGMGTSSFDRIEVSNIVDNGYVGTRGTLLTLAPLLRQKSQNAHAALLALYLNAVGQVASPTYNMRAEIKQVMKYFPPVSQSFLRGLNAPNRCDLVRTVEARTLLRDCNELFDRYAGEQKFGEIGKEVGMKVRNTNKIVEKWPLRLKDPSQQEFDIALGSGHNGSERYVEWERA